MKPGGRRARGRALPWGSLIASQHVSRLGRKLHAFTWLIHMFAAERK